MFTGAQQFYRRTLSACVRHQPIVLIVFFALVVATALLAVRIPKGFLPNDDTGQLFVFTQAAQDIGFDAMVDKQRQAVDIIRKDPNVDNVMAFVGAGGSSATLNLGRMIVNLKPPHERKGADEVVQECGRNCRASPASGVSAEPAADPHRRQADQSSRTSSCCRTPTPSSCSNGRRNSSRRWRKLRGFLDVSATC